MKIVDSIRNFRLRLLFRKAVKVDLTSVNMLLQNAVKDVQFAPNFGQSYHLLAVASNDIDLFTIKPAK